MDLLALHWTAIVDARKKRRSDFEAGEPPPLQTKFCAPLMYVLITGTFGFNKKL